MNLLLNNIRYTVSRTFDLYSLAPFKKLYATGLVYFLWANLFCFILAVGVIYPLSLLFPSAIYPELLEEETLMTFIESEQVLGLIVALLILSMSVFGIVLLRCKEEGALPKANLLDVLAHITSAEWKIAGWCVLVVIALHTLLFVPNFSETPTYITTTGTLFELLFLFKAQFLPCFLSMIIVLYARWGKVNFQIVREYKFAYLFSLLLLFGLSSVQYAVVHLVHDPIYSLSLFINSQLMEASVPVDTSWIVAIVTVTYVFIFLAALGIFAPALSAALSLPFYSEEERLKNPERNEAEDFVEGLEGDVNVGTGM